ncbi:unnamed protein product [Schistosoma rodhaini]|nr:unnamed protein product [Schistosoma rodhaini]
MGRDKSQLVGPNDETYDPTLKFEVHNDPEKDAEKLYEVVKGTDEHRIIKVLGHRNAYQRIEIRDTFKALYGKANPDRTLETDLSGHFQQLIVALLQAKRDEIPLKDVKNINKTDLQSVVDINQVEQDVETLWDAGEA